MRVSALMYWDDKSRQGSASAAWRHTMQGAPVSADQRAEIPAAPGKRAAAHRARVSKVDGDLQSMQVELASAVLALAVQQERRWGLYTSVNDRR